ncbi:MAG: NAD(P)-dependent oxidoreductase [Pseudomonadota bacterium]|nr:NAD(P)-dependent oxidoreductase [Pseudomonadota bacterium]
MAKKLKKIIGFVGLGIMGKPMVKNLLKSNYHIIFFARKKSVINEIRRLGGEFIPKIEDIPRKSKTIITNLPDSKDVFDVVLGAGGLHKHITKGSTIIDMSTIAPETTIFISNQLKKKNSDFIDAPVSGGEIGAKNGELSIMIGGEKKVFDKVKPILRVLGKNIKYIGKSGSGQITKACNQILVAETMMAVSEILILAKKSGCNQKLVRDALLGGFGYSKILDIHGLRMINKNYKPGFKASLHLKDLKIANKLAKKLKIQLKGAAYVNKLMQKTIDKKLGNNDSSIINKIIESYNK